MDDQPINVCWISYHEPDIIARGYWDQSILEDMFRDGYYLHYDGFEKVPPDSGAIVIINARTHLEDIAKINADIYNLKWCILILTGDEEGQFAWQQISHPMLRVWVQLPRMNVHNDVSQKLPNGPRPGTRETLRDIGQLPRDIDYLFIGQVNHERREQCVEEANALLLNYTGVVMTGDTFGKEIVSQEEYCRLLAHTKIAFCPSGIQTPDTFRLYEALEAGCLPVVDAFASRNQDWGFWNYLFEGELPFPIIPYWSDLPSLLPQLLKDYPRNANKASAWWQNIKRKIHLKLLADIKELNR